MKIDTKYFGEIEIGDEKVIHFDNGVLGFEDYKDYTILYDIDAEEEPFFFMAPECRGKSTCISYS